MTFSEEILAPSERQLSIALLVLPLASIFTVAATLDPLRSANRHLGREAFRWRVVTPDGAAAPLTCGIELPSAGPLTAAEGADVLIVLAGFRQAEVATRHLIGGLRRMAPRFGVLGGIDAGPWVLARAGLLDGYRATVHWENLEDLATAHPQVEVLPDRYVISGARMTAGGAAPATDLMLHLIRARLGAALALQVANSFIYDARRDGAEPQVSARPTARAEPRVAAAVAAMEARIETPVPVTAIATEAGVSPRRLEQLFRAELGMGPGAYFLELRLQAARRLVVDTHHSLQTVALRTGFASQAAFSRGFRRRFGRSPAEVRKGAIAGRGPSAEDV